MIRTDRSLPLNDSARIERLEKELVRLNSLVEKIGFGYLIKGLLRSTVSVTGIIIKKMVSPASLLAICGLIFANMLFNTKLEEYYFTARDCKVHRVEKIAAQNNRKKVILKCIIAACFSASAMLMFWPYIEKINPHQ